MCKLKQKLMAGITAGAVVLGTVSSAFAGNWMEPAMASVGSLIGILLAVMLTPTTILIPGLPMNIDPVQIAEEAGLLVMMMNAKDQWQPKPQKEYKEAAQSNGGGGGGGGGDIDNNTTSLVATLSFQVASLHNVGIEAIDVGPALSDVISAETRNDILTKLGTFQPSTGTSSSSNTNNNTTGNQNPPGAGSCAAPYTICEREVTDTEKAEIAVRQEQNQQWFATAGIAHAELGMKSVYQAIVNDGGAIDATGASASQEEVKVAMANAKNVKVQDLTGLIGIAVNTVMAQKIVALMNLELAQRLNQGNMLQGSTLTIEAAKALRKTGGLEH